MGAVSQNLKSCLREFLDPPGEARAATLAEWVGGLAFMLVAVVATVFAAGHTAAGAPPHDSLGLALIALSLFLSSALSRKSGNELLANHGSTVLLVASGVLQPVPLVLMTVFATGLAQLPQRRAMGGWPVLGNFVAVTVLCSLTAHYGFAAGMSASGSYLVAMAAAVWASFAVNILLMLIVATFSKELEFGMIAGFAFGVSMLNVLAMAFCSVIVAASQHETWLLLAVLVPPITTKLLEVRAHATSMARAELVVDPLTGVYNRRYFWQRLEDEMTRSRAEGTSLGLLMVDIDHFKRINDNYGHLEGDQALIGAARALHAEGAGLVCRFGGEEFGIILPGLAGDDLIAAAERARKAAAEALRPWGTSVSIGTTTLDLLGFDYSAHAYVNRADKALYAAKSGGRDRVVCGDSIARAAAAAGEDEVAA